MKIRTTKYILKEGFSNVYRNKLMSLASISIVTASLFIFGFFLLISFNANYNAQTLKGQSTIIVFCRPELDDAQLDKLEGSIKSDARVKEFRKISKKEAFEEVKKMVEQKESILEGLDEGFLPVSFEIRLNDPKDSMAFVEQYKKIKEVENVRYSQKTIDFIAKITYWVRFISGLLLVILLVISAFIISNTIKLTVFARRKEIGIMKYIGATDWFIRWPFIVEGVIIGMLGAVVSFVLVSYVYNLISNLFRSDLGQAAFSIFRLLRMNEIGSTIAVVFFAIGAGVGILGSYISLRKHLHV